jgi:hypothetical protein
MVAVIKMTWEHQLDGKCSKFAYDLNKIQSGYDLQCLILCSFEITFSYNIHLIIHSFISIQPLGRFSRDQSPVR